MLFEKSSNERHMAYAHANRSDTRIHIYLQSYLQTYACRIKNKIRSEIYYKEIYDAETGGRCQSLISDRMYYYYF